MEFVIAAAVSLAFVSFAPHAVANGNPLSRAVMISAPDCVGPQNIIAEEGVLPPALVR